MRWSRQCMNSEREIQQYKKRTMWVKRGLLQAHLAHCTRLAWSELRTYVHISFDVCVCVSLCTLDSQRTLCRGWIHNDFFLKSCLILRLLAVGEKLLAMDSEGERWYLSSFFGAASVHEASLSKGGCSRF